MDKSNNKTIFHLDKTYKPLLRKICCQVISFYPNSPLEWEDLYWDFLYYFTKNKEYDPSCNITFATFIGIECKNFVRNKVSGFITKSHRVLNGYIPIDETAAMASDYYPKESEEAIRFRESKFIDTFDKTDRTIIEEHLINKQSLLSISKKLGGRYKDLIRRKITIKSKIRNFINN